MLQDYDTSFSRVYFFTTPAFFVTLSLLSRSDLFLLRRCQILFPISSLVRPVARRLVLCTKPGIRDVLRHRPRASLPVGGLVLSRLLQNHDPDNLMVKYYFPVHILFKSSPFQSTCQLAKVMYSEILFISYCVIQLVMQVV
ncbi:hypothetical protein TNCV_3032071 [Trichonephila clavipes]|nr:hypothetical protein TNCV_3032071 [Trichonephila clavipes]